MRKHLDKCEPYHQTLKTKGNKTHTFDQKTCKELVARVIIKHGYAFSWFELEVNKEIHTYLNYQLKTIYRNIAQSDVLKMHASLKGKLKILFAMFPVVFV